MYKRITKINNKDVSGMPDLRFETYPKSDDYTPKLLVVTEVSDEFYAYVLIERFFFIMMRGANNNYGNQQSTIAAVQTALLII